MQAQESKFDSPVPLVFGQKSDLMSKYEYINYIHTLIYSTICMIKSFLKFNVHICIHTPRMQKIWKHISCRSQFHYFFVVKTMVKPRYFMIKTMVSCRFSQQNQSKDVPSLPISRYDDPVPPVPQRHCRPWASRRLHQESHSPGCPVIR